MNAPNSTQPDAEVIARIARESMAPQKHPHPDGLPFVVAPEGSTVIDLHPPSSPDRIRGTTRLNDAASFVAFVGRFSNANSIVYWNDAPAKFVAVLNEHDDGGGEAGWRDWRAVYQPAVSSEWEVWTAQDKKMMSQILFAEFLESNLPDVIEPDSARLLEMVLAFEATKAGAFKSVQRLQSGDLNIAWVDETIGGGAIQMPPTITLLIPVYERQERFSIDARLRYRIKDGGLTLWYELIRPHKVVDAAIAAIALKIKNSIGGMPMLMGEP